VVIFNKNNQESQLRTRLDNFFYPILHHLLGQKEGMNKLEQYRKYLYALLDKHKEMVRLSPDSTTFEKIN